MKKGYCMNRTQGRLVWLLWALLCLLISISLGAAFLIGMKQDRSYWETMDYVTLAVSGGGTVVMCLFGIYLGYVAVRDAFFPEKSSLAKSIRRQLPHPDEAPPVEELFAMVDKDLEEHGQRFGPVLIGREWALGDEASYIERIRGIFTVDKIRQHHTETGVRTNRILQLVLIDNRWQRNITDFRSPKELQAAAECLALRVPGAQRGRNGEYTNFWSMKEEEREVFEREFQRKRSQRDFERLQKEMREGSQDMILRTKDDVTSRVTSFLVEETLKQCLADQSGSFSLTPTRPVLAGRESFRALHVRVERVTVSLLLEMASASGGKGVGLAKETEQHRAQEILEGWLSGQVPDLTDWEMRQIR